MMNLNVYSNYLNLLTKHIISIVFLLVIFAFEINAASNITFTDGDDTVYVSTKSPVGALLRSAVLPGWGQIYNESYWKAPIVWGVAVWFVYVWNFNNDRYWQFQNFYTQTNDSRYKSIRDFYRDQRDLFSIYLGLTYVLNLIDAYVDAHLFDFSVTEDYFTRSPMLNIRIRF